MLDYIFGYENWLLEDPQRLADFRIAVIVITLFVVMAIAIARLWYENRKKDQEIHYLLDYIYTPTE